MSVAAEAALMRASKLAVPLAVARQPAIAVQQTRAMDRARAKLTTLQTEHFAALPLTNALLTIPVTVAPALMQGSNLVVLPVASASAMARDPVFPEFNPLADFYDI